MTDHVKNFFEEKVIVGSNPCKELDNLGSLDYDLVSDFYTLLYDKTKCKCKNYESVCGRRKCKNYLYHHFFYELSKDPKVYLKSPHNWSKSIRFLERCILTNPECFDYMDEKIHDTEFIRRILCLNPKLIFYMGKVVQNHVLFKKLCYSIPALVVVLKIKINDEMFFYKNIHNHSSLIFYIPDKLKRNYNFIVDMIRLNPNVFHFANNAFFSNKMMLLNTLKMINDEFLKGNDHSINTIKFAIKMFPERMIVRYILKYPNLFLEHSKYIYPPNKILKLFEQRKILLSFYSSQGKSNLKRDPDHFLSLYENLVMREIHFFLL